MRRLRVPTIAGLCTPEPPMIPGRAPALPASVVSAPPEPEPAAPRVMMDCSPMLTGLLRGRLPQRDTVALICQDEMLRERIRRDLEAEGHTVLAAASGPALIPALVGATPSLLLVDDEVVDPEPYELCATLRDDPALSSVAIVLLTRRVGLEARRIALHAGADELIPLPYLRSELRARVSLRLELAQLRAAGAQAFEAAV
jgi:CheY-like chemotaxis protein